jgi:hypothetical protein
MAICLCKNGSAGPFCNFISTSSSTSTKQSILKSSKSIEIYGVCPIALSNLCQNGGLCRKSNSNTFECQCKPGYSGTFCNLKEPFCSNPNRCKNGGTCFQVDQTNGRCECSSKFKGIYCEIGLECEPNPCFNNQPCILINGLPKCICTDQFSGTYCNKSLISI